MKKRKNKSVEKPEDVVRDKRERDKDEETAPKVELRWVGPRTVEVIGGEDPDPNFVPEMLPLPSWQPWQPRKFQ